MDKREIQELLDRTYELEGLLHLALARIDDLPAQLPGLIFAKIAELSDNEEYEEYDNLGAEDDVRPERQQQIAPEEEVSEDIPDVAVDVNADDDEEEEDINEISSVNHPRVERRKNPCVFSLNDRFLYIRELFGGSAKAFDDAMDVLSGMSDMREAEEYFYDECNLEPENATVAEFMKSVGRYLEQ